MNMENIFAADFGSFGSIATVTLIALVLIYYVLTCNSKGRNSQLPPGPRGIPLLGNVLQMVKNPHLKLSKWATEFGKLYTVQLANKSLVIVNDAAWMKELFGTIASTGKFKTDTILLLSQGPNGIINTEGPVWAEQRQFCIRSLRRLGFGQSSSIEPLILHEGNELCEWILTTANNDPQGHVDLKPVLGHASINALWSLVAGERFSFDDCKFTSMWSTLLDAVQYTMKTGLGFLPWLKHIAPNLSGYASLYNASKDIHEFVAEKFEAHQKTYEKGKQRDLIDAYIEHMNYTNENEGNGESSFFGKQGWVNSVCSVVELFLGGGETVASTLKWAAVYLSHNPEVQRKLQNEIDDVFGRDRDPSLLDKARMPYTEAVILETLRLSSLVMFGHLHELLDDVPFHGYTLPKGTLVAGNIYHIHHNPVTWGDPEHFRPERFLMDEGLKDYVVAFHVGKRQCLGDQLAKDVMFIFIVKMFQKFQFKPVSTVSKEDYLQPDVGIILLPKCSEFVIASR